MNKITQFLGIVFFLLLLSSCYVQQPQYTEVNKLTLLKPRMKVDSVSKVLGVQPHDLISLESDGSMVLLYKYRVKEIKRVPIFMRKNKGLKVDGKWKDLLVMVDPNGEVYKYETRVEELKSDAENRKIDPNKVIQSITMALTVVLPALLVFFSSK